MAVRDLLPTPVVVDNPHPNSKVNEQGRRFNEKAESSHSMGLADLAHHNLLPTPFLKTPCAMDCSGDTRKSKGVSGTSGTLTQEIASGYATRVRGLEIPMLLPTPLVVEREHPERVEALKATGATKINSRANGEQRPNGIVDFMNFYGMLPESLPTPSARDWKGKTNPGVVKEGSGCVYGETLPDTIGRLMESDAEDAGSTSRLSPLFTEEMMGFPFLWTTLPFLRPSGAPKPSKPTATP
jgi:hypothetical protein